MIRAMSGTRATLYIVGAVLEVVGIILVASPDLVPGAVRLARWVRPRWRRVENRVRRILRLPPGGITYEDAATVGLNLSISTAAEVGFNPEASLEDKVAFLLRRNSETQKEMNALSQRLDAIETEAPKRVDELRAELEAHIAHELTAAKEDYRAARIGGAMVLAVGLALTTTGNFVS